jgi:hypothetical protein
MSRTEKLSELRELQARCDTIRQELEINPPGKITFSAPLDVTKDNMVVIEADGFGGATTSVVEGNYPVDYMTKFERSCLTEEEAVATAEALAFQGARPSQVLGPPVESAL